MSGNAAGGVSGDEDTAPREPTDAERRLFASETASQGACVALGGALGALTRAGLDLLAADPLSAQAAPLLLFSWSTILADLLGAFLLGLLSARLARRPAPSPALVRLRMLTATGFLGAFTTYGTIQGATAQRLLGDPTPGAILAALLPSLVLIAVGVVAAASGWMLGRGRCEESR